MAFTQKLPVWLASGVEPPEILKNEGWKAGIKPPDAYFNYLQNTAYLALKELQEKAAEASALTGKVDKEVGKGLSTNDYTTADKTKLGGIASGANNYTHPATHPPSIIVQDANNRFMTDAERTKLTGIEAGANKYIHPTSHPATMITEDATHRFMTDSERTKLQGIQAGATNYQHPDTHPATMITEDATHRFATDAEKTSWNSKETPAGAQAKADRALLDANNFANSLSGNRIIDNRSVIPKPSDYTANRTSQEFKASASVGLAGKAGTYVHLFTERAWSNDSGGYVRQLAYDGLTTKMWTRYGNQTTQVWGEWSEIESAEGSQLKANTAEANAKVYTDTKVASIVSSAPETLDTLNELATALGNDPNFATTVANQIGGKVDKVSGKQLSTNDYTTPEKTKLAGIATGANNYTHPASHPPAIIAQDANNRFSTDAEKTSWNGKETPAGAQAKVNALAGPGNTKTVKQLDEALTIHSADKTSHVQAAEREEWNAKATPEDVRIGIEQTTYSVTKSAPDADGTFTTIEYKRKSDGSLAAKSVLSGGTAPKYTTRTITYYGTDGLATGKVDVFALTYNADGALIGEV